MRQILFALSSTIMLTILSTDAQGEPSIKHTASISEFAAKVEVLDGIVDDLIISCSLALLRQVYPDWTFEGNAGFEGKSSVISDDIASIAGASEYRMSKLRGAFVRNKAVSEDQRQRGLEVFDSTKELVLHSYDIERFLNAGKKTEAASLFRETIVPAADETNEKIQALIDEVNLEVKLSAL